MTTFRQALCAFLITVLLLAAPLGCLQAELATRSTLGLSVPADVGAWHRTAADWSDGLRQRLPPRLGLPLSLLQAEAALLRTLLH